MPRSVPPWTGKDDDAVPPPRVRARVFETHGGRCHRCGVKIAAGRPWTCEHLVALINGGRNAEDNLGISCEACTPVKNAQDAAIKKKIAAVRARHIGTHAPKRPIRSAGFPKAKRTREIGEKERQLREMRERAYEGR